MEGAQVRKESFALEGIESSEFGFLDADYVWVQDGDGVTDRIALLGKAQATNVPRQYSIGEALLIHGCKVTTSKRA